MSTEKTAKLVSYLLLRRGAEIFLVRYREDRSPNAKRVGWWIPAPELTFGEHPEEAAQRILRSLGAETATLQFVGVDSFVTRDWHVLFQYVADLPADAPLPLPLAVEYERGEWFAVDQLPAAKELAHGNWERELAIKLAQFGR